MTWLLKLKKNKKGAIAEFMCRIYMRLHGYRIVEKNYRCGSGKNTCCGEIDFIASKNHSLVFCEVKERSNYHNFCSALSSKQQERIINGAYYFIKKHKSYHSFNLQFDVFFVKFPFYIKHMRNAIYRDYRL